MFYEQLNIDIFCNFCPQNEILPEKKTENTLKSGPDSLLVFLQLRSLFEQ